MFENAKLFYLFLLLPFLVGLFIFFNISLKKSATKLAGKNIMSFSEFKKELNKHEVGETVEVVVVREGREKSLKVYLSEYKGE